MEDASRSGPLYPSIEYGAYLGLIIAVANSLRTALFGFQDGGISGWLVTFLGIGLLAYFIKMYRDNEGDGTLTYSQGLGFGTLIGLFAGLIMGLYIYVYLKLFGSDVINDMLAQIEELLKEQDLGDEQKESMMSIYRSFYTPIWLGVVNIFRYTFLYFIASLIIAAIMKRSSANE